MAFTAAMGGGDPSRLSALGILADAALLGYRFDEAFANVGESFEEGSASLVEAIAKDVGGEVRLGAVVTRVRRDDQGVTLDLADGGRLHARAGVVTLPGERLAGGGVRSTVVVGETADRGAGEPRRIDQGPGRGPWRAPGLPGGRVARHVAGRRGRPRDDGRSSGVGFSGVGGIDPGDPSAVEKALRAYLPDCDVLTSGGHDWVSDPFSRGTWFAPPPGWESGDAGAQIAPEGRLAFAGGDIAPVGAGWIEGAILSGRDAARAVLGFDA